VGGSGLALTITMGGHGDGRRKPLGNNWRLRNEAKTTNWSPTKFFNGIPLYESGRL